MQTRDTHYLTTNQLPSNSVRGAGRCSRLSYSPRFSPKEPSNLIRTRIASRISVRLYDSKSSLGSNPGPFLPWRIRSITSRTVSLTYLRHRQYLLSFSDRVLEGIRLSPNSIGPIIRLSSTTSTHLSQLSALVDFSSHAHPRYFSIARNVDFDTAT